MDTASLVRKARAASGLSQAELARLAATSQSAVAAYESGTKQPSWSVLERLVEATGNQLHVSLSADPGLYRLADLAQDLRQTADSQRRFRLFLEFLRGAKEDGRAVQLLVSAEPESTGDAGYDALLAAVAEDLCVTAAVPAPAWTASPGRFLEGFWWVSSLPSARARALVHSPASYRRRGVMLDRVDLQVA